MKIFLDDLRKCPKGWKSVLSAEYCVNLLQKNNVKEISLDYNLGIVGKNGYDVLLWIEKQVITNNYIPPKINIHTSDLLAAHKMELMVKNILKRINGEKFC